MPPAKTPQDLSPFKLYSCRMPELWEVTAIAPVPTPAEQVSMHPQASSLPPDALWLPTLVATITVALRSFR